MDDAGEDVSVAVLDTHDGASEAEPDARGRGAEVRRVRIACSGRSAKRNTSYDNANLGIFPCAAEASSGQQGPGQKGTDPLDVSLSGKVAVVTGSGPNIGSGARATRDFASQGY